MEFKEIFISYKSEEFNDALWVKEKLEAEGITCWMAPMSITGGASYATEIPAAIQNCKVFLLILSDIVQESKWVPRELDQAINADKIIMPFMIKNCPLNDEFSFYLSNVQRYYAYIDKDESFKKLLTDICTYLKKELPTKKSEDENNSENTEQQIPTSEIKADMPLKQKKEKSKHIKTNKSKKKTFTKLVIILLMIIGLCVSISELNKVKIADESYKKSDYTLILEKKTLTAEDISNIAKFKNISALYIRDCTITASSLASVNEHDLLTLVIANCSLTDTQFNSISFESFNRLATLSLSGNKNISNLSKISSVSDTLESLCLDEIKLKDSDFLRDFKALKKISINNTDIDDLTALINMAYLEELSASGNNIKNLDGLENATVLETVNLSDNKIKVISQLRNSHETLKTLNLDNNNISDASKLSECKNITNLSMANNDLSDVSWTKTLNRLVTLDLSANKIKSLEGITQSSFLRNINLSENKLESIEGLTFTTDGYVSANFSDNKITSVCLPTDCRYSNLFLHSNKIEDSSFLEVINGSEISLDYSKHLDTAHLSCCSFTSIYILDCPTNKVIEFSNIGNKIKLETSKEFLNR